LELGFFKKDKKPNLTCFKEVPSRRREILSCRFVFLFCIECCISERRIGSEKANVFLKKELTICGGGYSRQDGKGGTVALEEFIKKQNPMKKGVFYALCQYWQVEG